MRSILDYGLYVMTSPVVEILNGEFHLLFHNQFIVLTSGTTFDRVQCKGGQVLFLALGIQDIWKLAALRSDYLATHLGNSGRR